MTNILDEDREAARAVVLSTKHSLGREFTPTEWDRQIEAAAECHAVQREQRDEARRIATKACQDEQAAHRVSDCAKELLAKAYTSEPLSGEEHEDTMLGAVSDLALALQGDQPYTPWSEVREELDEVAVQREHAEKAETELELLFADDQEPSANVARRYLALRGRAGELETKLERAEYVHKEQLHLNDLERERTQSVHIERERLQRERDCLWVLLDDIDTASDIYERDYEGLAKRVYALQQKRHGITSGDEVLVSVARSCGLMGDKETE